jgi:hypothetical protein
LLSSSASATPQYAWRQRLRQLLRSVQSSAQRGRSDGDPRLGADDSRALRGMAAEAQRRAALAGKRASVRLDAGIMPPAASAWPSGMLSVGIKAGVARGARPPLRLGIPLPR